MSVLKDTLIKIRPTVKPLQSWWRVELFFHLILPLTVAVIVLFFFPYRAQFEFSSDEGVNLMKSMLMDNGYQLYGQIWSDQPPLFSYILAGVMRLAGYNVAPARTLILIFTCLLLWAAIQFMRLTWGNGVAFTSVILLFLLPRFFFLSFAVMIGMPAIALAMLSLLFLAYWHRQRKWIWLALSAAILTLSVLTKLFTGLLAPIFLIGLVTDEYYRGKAAGKTWLQILFPGVVWGVIFGLLGLVIGLALVGWDNIPQLLQSHLAAASAPQYAQTEFTLGWYLRPLIPFLVLSILGATLTIQRKSWLSLYLVAWAGLAYALLAGHTPVWDHHQLLITIPAAMMAAIAVYEIVYRQILVQSIIKPLMLNFASLLIVLSLVTFIGYFFPFQIREPFNYLSLKPVLNVSDLYLGPNYDKILRVVFKYAPKTEWMVTDLPMFAYRAGLLVPPNLAVITSKRYTSGLITEDEIVQTIKDYQPGIILLGRFEYPMVKTSLTRDYQLVYEADQADLFIRKDLIR